MDGSRQVPADQTDYAALNAYFTDPTIPLPAGRPFSDDQYAAFITTEFGSHQAAEAFSPEPGGQ